MDRHRSITGLLPLMFVPACDGDQLTGSTIFTATGGGVIENMCPLVKGRGATRMTVNLFSTSLSVVLEIR